MHLIKGMTITFVASELELKRSRHETRIEEIEMKIQMFANAPFQIYAETSTRVKSTNLVSTTQYLPDINRFISEEKLG